MKKKKELKYLNKLGAKIEHDFKSFAQTQNPEALHDFRVQVKKLRSFLTLLESGHKNDKLLKTFKPVKKIFRSTGVIRDAQVHQKQAEENNIGTPGLYQQQDNIKNEETVKLLQHKRRHIRSLKKVQYELQHRVQPVTQMEIEQFFIIQVQNTEALLSNHNFSEQLHSGRKMLKHLLYNRNLIPPVVAKNMNISFDDIDKMQQAIGDWHDNKLALDFFNGKLPDEQLEAVRQKQAELEKNITAKADGFAQANEERV